MEKIEKIFFIIYIAFALLLLVSGACAGTAKDTKPEITTSLPMPEPDSIITKCNEYSIVEIKRELNLSVKENAFGYSGKFTVVNNEKSDVTYYVINIDGYAVILNSVHPGYNHLDLNVFEYDKYYIKFSNEFGQESIYLIIKE